MTSRGALLNNIWSFAGDSDRANVNVMMFQPFINYNMKDGWFLTSSPVMTANWEATSGNRFTILWVAVSGASSRSEHSRSMR